MTLSQLSLQKRIPPPPSLELFAQPIFNLLLRFELTVPKPFPKKALLNLSDLSCPNIFYIFFFSVKENLRRKEYRIGSRTSINTK